MAHPSDRTRGAPPGQPQSGERVARALARAGVASRRDAERIIAEGRVAVNGVVLESPAVNVAPGDILTLDGKVVADAEPARLWRHHKPAGLITSHKDPKGRPTVFEALPKEMPRVISVGRLDLATEGLILLTNDGDLARALELPSSGWVRTYRARAFGRTSQARLDALAGGVVVDGIAYGPVKAVIDRPPKDAKASANIWLTVSITEGKNREVRKLLEHVGLKVSRLIRVAYGPFELADLPAGAVAEVPPPVLRRTLGDMLPRERLTGHTHRLFHWAPDKAPRRRMPPKPAGKAAVPAPEAKAAAEPARKPRSERKPKTAYKDGWARPKPKPGPARPAKKKPRRKPSP